MSRPLRIQAPGLTYHVTARGNDRLPIYADDEDRLAFLDRFAAVVAAYRVVCHAYSLMTNHYHLVVTTADANISRVIQQLNGPYAQWRHRRHGSVGHVFQGRFGAQIIQDDTYLLVAVKYVALNPVRGGLVAALEDWPWSSYAATAGLASPHRCLDVRLLWRMFGGRTVVDAIRRYRAFVRPDDAVLTTLPDAPILGDADFVDGFWDRRVQASREVPAVERSPRPGLDAIFVGAATRAERRGRVVDAFRRGYSMATIARFLDVHPSTISRAVRIGRVRPDRAKRADARPDPRSGG